jgi:hypothetical protein
MLAHMRKNTDTITIVPTMATNIRTTPHVKAGSAAFGEVTATMRRYGRFSGFNRSFPD